MVSCPKRSQPSYPPTGTILDAIFGAWPCAHWRRREAEALERVLESDPVHGQCRPRTVTSELWHDSPGDSKKKKQRGLCCLQYGTESGLSGFKECIAKSRPAIILGVVEKDGWRAASRWASAEMLSHHYGDVMFDLSQRWLPGLRVPLWRYIEYTLKNTAANPFYLWHSTRLDYGGKGFTGAQKPILQDFQTPKWFSDDVYEWLGIHGGSFTYFLCGGRGTGSKLHVDPMGTCAWNTLLCGSKRWCMFPPTHPTIPEAEYKEIIGATSDFTSRSSPCTDWFEKVYPRVKARAKELGMVEYVQRAGETLFVPAEWWHNVLNLDFTIAITRNHMLADMVPQALKNFERGTPDMVSHGEAMLQGLRQLDSNKRLACGL